MPKWYNGGNLLRIAQFYLFNHLEVMVIEAVLVHLPKEEHIDGGKHQSEETICMRVSLHFNLERKYTAKDWDWKGEVGKFLLSVDGVYRELGDRPPRWHFSQRSGLASRFPPLASLLSHHDARLAVGRRGLPGKGLELAREITAVTEANLCGYFV